ncbi:MAG TPA: transposase [Hyphomicrobiaceae bacterium]|nr:transposase [Hyphomicrobiaceae bacterium]
MSVVARLARSSSTITRMRRRARSCTEVVPLVRTNACRTCALKAKCTKGRSAGLGAREHGEVLEAVQARLDRNPDAMRTRRETVEHPFGTIKMRMEATHFLMNTLPKVATKMALCVLAYNLFRVFNIVGVDNLLQAIKA